MIKRAGSSNDVIKFSFGSIIRKENAIETPNISNNNSPAEIGKKKDFFKKRAISSNNLAGLQVRTFGSLPRDTKLSSFAIDQTTPNELSQMKRDLKKRESFKQYIPGGQNKKHQPTRMMTKDITDKHNVDKIEEGNEDSISEGS